MLHVEDGPTQEAESRAADATGEEDQGEEHAQAGSFPAVASTSQHFTLVSDHGQTFLVPTARASKYSSLPAPGHDYDSGNSTPILRKRKLVRVPVKRGRGRPPKHGYKKFEFVEEEEDDEEEYADEFEGSAAPEDGEGGEEYEEGEEILPVPIELNVHIAGKDYVLNNDHVRLPEDETGDGKVDWKGQLLGSRQYKMPIFQSTQRPDPEIWYALSIDTARAVGFRDSFFFYKRNPLLIKLSCTNAEKVKLISSGRLPAHLRTRNVTMLAVRNVFKLFGHRVVLNGQATMDDYYENDAPEQGNLPADTPAPEAQQQATAAPTATRTSERKQKELERERERYKRRADAFTYASTDLHGNPWFTTFGDAGEAPFERAKAWTARRTNAMRAELNEDNWMLEMARSVRGMNKELLSGRQERLRAFGRPYESIEAVVENGKNDIKMAVDDDLDNKEEVLGTKRKLPVTADLPIGIYEPLTNVPHFPLTLQSQRATIERLYERPVLDHIGDAAASTAAKRNLAVLGRNRVGPDAWGVATIEERVELPKKRVASNVRIPSADALKQMDY
jgi:chromatin structure-remodeling complex protein RSC7